MIRWEVRGQVAVATLERPERRNALHAPGCDQLRRYLEDADGVRAVVLTGAGSAFCAGADLGTRFDLAHSEAPGHSEALKGSGSHEPGGEWHEQRRDTFRPAFEGLLDALGALPAPVIAAVHGPAIGAGTQLAVACDIRVADDRARFGIPAGKLGIHLHWTNIQRLVQLVGPGPARDLLLTSRTIGVDEAERMGLVDRRADDALAAALEVADEIATLAPLTVAGHKHALELISERGGLRPGTDDDAIAAIDADEERAFASDDLRIGMEAFAAKTRPEFEGH
ncbi:MAG: enoyl-CoA hydratase/isomerase family protein [Acidimicrobiia bacterium]|nr:enoyl-CoA hydratase/isomerase family protein [Acidimicrobiia bacterium]